ncbi:dTDP-glucose 4,6-dehydratase [Leptospirillum ferrooxidans]|jgi:dTDP-glucose 4,6-dehydratase|uniref:dTDP-glucose 4,6-dehydratase n=1 Tax=Leptospirillum ferrooxidans (strain C2-3) TaxID=1162668 RepID=I0IML7_LEPFC|nr:dTDP-glucose 4,6-dehydratase [Leptospirillum ferrooxidans]BAM06516.1 putative DTDP-glucose 4,6-dehydratase [Leptospirillum ferrooxidans C2-3]
MSKRWLVTGGAGFIGSNFVLEARKKNLAKVLTLDLLTYAGNRTNLSAIEKDPDHEFVHGDISDPSLVRSLIESFKPTAIFHFAAESHVDRSIDHPGIFLKTNVEGTFVLLDEARKYLSGGGGDPGEPFRFIHVSTDEVFGSLGAEDPPFTETTPYAPNSPYAASKAASDHLARAYFHTYGLPVITTNCSNNFGPWQFPEKLIPTVVLAAIEGKEIPLYGDGLNIRDWLYVGDHVQAILRIHEAGIPGETYNIGGNSERTNQRVIETILSILDQERPRSDGHSYSGQVRHVTDRPGHDRRYAMDASRLKRELGWTPEFSFESAIGETVRWYLANEEWWREIRSRKYAGERLGVLPPLKKGAK